MKTIKELQAEYQAAVKKVEQARSPKEREKLLKQALKLWELLYGKKVN